MRILITTLVVLGLWLVGTLLVPSPRVNEAEKANRSTREPEVESEAENISSTVQL